MKLGELTRGRRALLPAGIAAAVLLAGAACAPSPVRAKPLATLSATLSDPDGSLSVRSAAFSPDGTLLAAGDADDSAYLFDPATKRLVATLTAPGATSDDDNGDDDDDASNAPSVNTVTFSPDGKLVAAGDSDDSIYLWSPASHQLLATLTDPGADSEGVASIAFSNDARLLAAGDLNGTTYLWNTATRQIDATLTAPGNPAVFSVAFSPDGSTLAVATADDSTYLWNLTSHQLLATLRNPGADSEGVASIAFSNDARLLAAGDQDGTTYLWNVATHRIVAKFHDAGHGVDSVAFSRDSRLLAVGNKDDTTDVWDVTARHLRMTLPGHGSSEGVASVEFGPGGVLAAGDDNGSTYLWTITAGSSG